MIIGISSSLLKLSKSIFPKRFYVNDAYVKSLQNCQGFDLSTYILPFGEKKDFKALLEVTNGIILSGGFDIHPSFYGQKSSKKLGKTCKQRDRFELALLEEALKQNICIFGICRGMQLLNIFLGGSLYQDISKKTGLKHRQKQKAKQASHQVHIKPQTFLSSFLPSFIWVNSFHHQSINILAKALKINASSDVIEGVELKESKNLVFGVQWHPEVMQDLYSKNLFQAFLKACEKNKI